MPERPGTPADARAAIARLDGEVAALLARREQLVRAAGRLGTDGVGVGGVDGVLDGVVVGPAAPGSAGEVLTVQRAAYLTEAQLYGDPAIPPLTETLDQVAAAVAAGSALTATVGPRVVGAVRGTVADGVLAVGRLAVAPDQQGRGVGTALLVALERWAGAAAHRAVLFTGARSEGNLRLYRRLGYREEHRERISPAVELVHLGKDL
ncbi:GNAT family N-acetyltransferase [Geodermatophilus sp. URMC 62]|uniref:GNAT family N-acetyltransferase n=1 Tax=Geodermatophilus sp. URMC 62 TaxID=3423414 RepID=UPI00406C0F34